MKTVARCDHSALFFWVKGWHVVWYACVDRGRWYADAGGGEKQELAWIVVERAGMEELDVGVLGMLYAKM